jgi:glycosyltransferase involved in cell wall biosynthesis
MKNDNLRILFPFVGDTVGGSHVSAWQLMHALKDLSVIPVILIHQKGKYMHWVEEQGGAYELVELPFIRSGDGPLRNWCRILAGTYSARKLIRKLNIDLVHCNDGRMNLTWAPWAMAEGIPMVWHQRARWTDSRQLKASLSLASGVISISRFVAMDAPDMSIPHITIINPVAAVQRNREDCARRIREELGESKDCKLVVCLGNAKKWKRPDTFFKTAILLKEQYHKNIKFIWCGDDRDGLLDRMIEKAGPGSPVLRIPFRSDVSSVIAGSDIVLAPSENEPFGRTLVEAMSIGVPVVASDCGGHIEIITHEKNGLLFSVGDVQACSSAVIRLLDDRKLCQLFSNSGMESVNKFDPRKHAEKVFCFYKQLIHSDR